MDTEQAEAATPKGDEQMPHTKTLGPRGLINRTEYVRLIEQALQKLGYGQLAQSLEAVSGIQMQLPAATQFQQCLLAGLWDAALAVLPELLSGQPGSEEVLGDANFLVRTQQYLEALEAGDTPGALTVLRTQLAHLAGTQHTKRLHHLSGLLLCPSPPPTNLAARSYWTNWLNGGVAHRGALLAQMQAALPPCLMLPEARLEVLLEQALDTQIARCPFHNVPLAMTGPAGAGAGGSPGGVSQVRPAPMLSLLSDYQAGVESIPSRCIQVLDEHIDEVWHIAFSHSGLLLASGSKDKTAIIWAVRHPPSVSGLGHLGHGFPGSSNGSTPKLPQLVTHKHTLRGHDAAVLFLSWSPDDTSLLSVSEDTLRLWDPATGALRHTYTHHKEPVTSCAWMPDSQRFVSGSVDRTLSLLDVRGQELHKWKRSYRVQDLAVTADGSALVIAASDKLIHVLRLSDQREVTLSEVQPITSIDLSHDSRYLLANLQSQVVHLWALGSTSLQGSGGTDPLDKLPTGHLVEYREPSGGAEVAPGRYVLRSSFGGHAGSFVVHGSESGQVFIWHRDTGSLLLRLEGHTTTVNACAWPPALPQLMASASDDHTIRVWLSEAALRNA